MQITSGRGPAECCMVVYNILDIVEKEAESYKIDVTRVALIEGANKKTLKSALLLLNGDKLDSFRKRWEGPVKWIGESIFRPKHRRKNWFIGISFVVPDEEFNWSEKEFRFDTMRSSGPGGQHANKTSSCVRVVHIPSGIMAVATEERSQHLNKKLAKARIACLLKEKNDKSKERSEKDRWDNHNILERGNPVRVFKGLNFKEKL